MEPGVEAFSHDGSDITSTRDQLNRSNAENR